MTGDRVGAFIFMVLFLTTLVWHSRVMLRLVKYCAAEQKHHEARGGIADPVARAYSDMQTVISLGGRCEQKHSLLGKDIES